MPETAATLDELERMLFLRGVPLFSMLAPDDLQRLASTAVERTTRPVRPWCARATSVTSSSSSSRAAWRSFATSMPSAVSCGATRRETTSASSRSVQGRPCGDRRREFRPASGVCP